MDAEEEVESEEEMWVWVEWQWGVLRAERPADRAMWRRGTGGRERRVLWVRVKTSARSDQRDWLNSSC